MSTESDEQFLKGLSDTAEGDQADASRDAWCECVAKHYRGMLRAGLPEFIAGELALDFHWAAMSVQFPNLPPRTGSRQ